MSALSSPTRSVLRLGRLPILLIALVFLLQSAAWAGQWLLVLDITQRRLFSLMEMVLIGLLVWNGWRIRRRVAIMAEQHPHARAMNNIAVLCFVALAACSLGDAVNRNFAGLYFAYDDVIRHSYLADSVWFFFPGYLLFLVASWRATQARVPRHWQLPLLVAAAVSGVISFGTLVLPGTSVYVKAMTAPYTVLISMMVPAGVWCWLAFGKRGLGVATGAVLATVADALIGHFWLFGDGYFPAIAHLNFMVYFLSQALLQQLPLVYADSLQTYADCQQTGGA